MGCDPNSKYRLSGYPLEGIMDSARVLSLTALTPVYMSQLGNVFHAFTEFGAVTAAGNIIGFWKKGEYTPSGQVVPQLPYKARQRVA